LNLLTQSLRHDRWQV
jgi:hypothetical protein